MRKTARPQLHKSFHTYANRHQRLKAIALPTQEALDMTVRPSVPVAIAVVIAGLVAGFILAVVLTEAFNYIHS